MLAVQKRAFQNYFLMETNNLNQPSNFVGNKVTGILFENKCDHVCVIDLDSFFSFSCTKAGIMANPGACVLGPISALITSTSKGSI